ncbi:MAG: SBBP repeat-containing protein [Fimbriimonadales bacterium]
MAVDTSGNVYVTGESYGAGNFDYATIKYDSAGNEQWVTRYDGPWHNTDYAYALAVDTSGNIYVTGSSTGIGSSEDYGTIKYDSAGNEQWVARYNGPMNGYDVANSLALDASGNVYVTGFSSGTGSSFDYATIKYDSAGIEQWLTRYSGVANGYDLATALALDVSGNVYVTGYSAGTGSGFDYATVKYAPSTIRRRLVLPDAFTIQRGILIAGELSDLYTSDNERLEIQARPVVARTKPGLNGTAVMVEGNATVSSVSKLTFRAEALTTGFPLSRVTYKIELYNFVTRSWEVFVRQPSNMETVEDVEITTDPDRFIQPGTLRMRSRLSWFAVDVMMPNWGSKIDQAVWFVEQ